MHTIVKEQNVLKDMNYSLGKNREKVGGCQAAATRVDRAKVFFELYDAQALQDRMQTSM
jgi:hypothetical protein